MLELLLLAWIALLGLELRRVWSSGYLGVGLCLVYLLNLTLENWFGALAHSLPWAQLADRELVEEGFALTVLGAVAFTASSRLAARALAAKGYADRRTPHDVDTRIARGDRLSVIYIVLGFILVGVVFPAIGHLPTVNVLSFSGAYLIVSGLCLRTWRLWRYGRVGSIWNTGFWVLGLPILTIALTENAIRAVQALLLVLVFTAVFYRPRWHLLLAGAVAVYMGLSFGVTYLQERELIREDVREAASVPDKLAKTWRLAENFEWADFGNADHIALINARMNQSVLVGTAMDYVGSGQQEFSRGETLWLAVVALVPRAIWPEKPVEAGSMGLVSLYTGLTFAESVSVGLGPILEWYINWGALAVVLGMAFIGALLSWLDFAAGAALARLDLYAFGLRFVPALPILNTGGSFVEVTAAAAAALVLAALCNVLAERRSRDAARKLEARAE